MTVPGIPISASASRAGRPHPGAPLLGFFFLGVLPSALGGCAPALFPAAFADETPEIRPEAFFVGTTRSSGVLEDRGGAPTVRFRVEGAGTTLPDGRFRLDQTITFENEAPRTRTATPGR
jgi:hypothetical protein